MMEKENTFIGKDDLIHCSVCKEPKQAWLPENDLLGVRLRYRQCACERDANAIEKAEQEEKERRVQIAKNRQNCFDEATMKNKTFANTEEMTPAICKAKKYVDNWDEMKRNHIGCLFWGPVGTGKSYIAGCIANELLKQEVTVKMTNFNTIIDDIFPMADKTEYINALASYQLLIITTNLPLKEIKSETMLDKRRIYDRILEMCTPVYVGDTSKREAIASMKMEKAKTLLNTNRGKEECE